MKNKNGKNFQQNSGLLVVLVLLFIFGIYLIILSYSGIRKTVYAQYDRVNQNLTDTIDHNTAVLFEQCRATLSAACSGEAIAQLEEAFLHTGEGSVLAACFAQDTALLSGCAVRVLVLQEDTVVLSSQDYDTLDYLISGMDESNAPFMVTDRTRNKRYAAIDRASDYTSLRYVLLIDTDMLFRQVIPSSIYTDYWFLLYAPATGLTIQNIDNQPNCAIFTQEEMAAREDGYTALLEIQNAGITDITEYDYNSADKGTYHVRGVVLPVGLSENQAYTIGVFTDTDDAYRPLRQLTIFIALGAIFIAASSAWAIFLLISAVQRQRALSASLEALEKENILTKQLLDRQTELMHRQKLETIGRLTAGIAHEFNNLLTPIMGKILLIIEKLPEEDEETLDNASDVYEAARKAKLLVGNLNRLSRKNSAKNFKWLKPAALISDVLNITSPAIPPNITVISEVCTTALFTGDENQISQIFMNLIVNSVYAMTPDGGTLTFRAEDDGKNIIFSVADTGCGIPPAILNNIFEPFFTTKESGKGTGLGLSVAQSIVTAHGGTIHAENRPGGGTVLIVTFPAATSGEQEDTP